MLTSYKIKQLKMYDSILLVSNPYHAATIYIQPKNRYSNMILMIKQLAL